MFIFYAVQRELPRRSSARLAVGPFGRRFFLVGKLPLYSIVDVVLNRLVCVTVIREPLFPSVGDGTVGRPLL